MISNQTLEQGFDQLQTYFVSLFRSNKFISELKTNQQTRLTFEKSLNIFNYVCSNLDKLNNATEVLKQYHQLGFNPNFKYDLGVKFEDEYDLTDQINYLDIYCKNTYGTSVADLGNIDHQINLETPVLEPINDHTEDMKRKNAEQAQAAFFNFADPNPNTTGSSSQFDRAAFADQASKLRLHQEIRVGSFYCFQSKPKEILYIRYGLFIIYVVITVLFAVLSFMIFFQTQYKFSKDNLEQIFPSYKDKFTQINFPIPGIFFYGYQQTNSFVVIMSLFSGYSAYRNYKILFKSKNHNWMYRLELGGFFRLASFLAIFIMLWQLPDNSKFLSPFLMVELAKKAADSTQSNHQYFYQGLFIICVFILSLLGLVLTLFITGIFFNPKRDIEKINITLANYREEFFNSKF